MSPDSYQDEHVPSYKALVLFLIRENGLTESRISNNGVKVS